MVRSSGESSAAQNSTPIVFNSKQLSEVLSVELIKICSVASPEPHIVMTDSDSNEPTIPYGFFNQHLIVPPSRNDLNLPPNPFNVLVTMAVIQPDEEYSPLSPEPSNLSQISTLRNNLSTIEASEKPHTTRVENTIYSKDKPRRMYWGISPNRIFESSRPTEVSITWSPSSTPPPPRQQKRKLSMGMSFLQKKGVSHQTCEACGQPVPTRTTP